MVEPGQFEIIVLHKGHRLTGTKLEVAVANALSLFVKPETIQVVHVIVGKVINITTKATARRQPPP